MMPCWPTIRLASSPLRSRAAASSACLPERSADSTGNGRHADSLFNPNNTFEAFVVGNNNNFAYAGTVEQLLGIELTPRCVWLRTLLSEYNRLADHVTCIAATVMEMGAMTAFLYLMTVHRAAPAVYTSCLRTALCSPDPAEDVRLTVDRDIVCQPATGLEFAPDPRAWAPATGPEWHRGDEGCVVLELKFRGTAPWWMSELTQVLGLERAGYSKYVAAVTQALGEDQLADRAAVPSWEE